MDILILNNYIKKFSTEEENRKAMLYLNSFLETRKKNLNYYVILLNNVLENEKEESEKEKYKKWEYAILNKGEATIPDDFLKNFLGKPIPNKSVCFRQDINPFKQSNPFIGDIFGAINESLEKYNEHIKKIYILSPEKILPNDILELRKSIKESGFIDNDKTKIAIIGI